MWVVNLAHRFGIKKRRLLGSVWDGSALDETLWHVLKPWWFPDSQMGIWSEQFIGDLTMLEPGEICQGRWLAYPFLQPSREKSNEKDMYVFSDYYWLLLLLLLVVVVYMMSPERASQPWQKSPGLTPIGTAKSPPAEPVAPGSEASPMESTACSGCRRSVSCQ